MKLEISYSRGFGVSVLCGHDSGEPGFRGFGRTALLSELANLKRCFL